jgi:hypothetical protein
MTWIRAAATVASYRRMYRLAEEIAAHDGADKSVRRAARRILRCLEQVIDLPIAEGAKLARAVQRFRELRVELDRVVVLLDVSETSGDRDARAPGSLPFASADTASPLQQEAPFKTPKRRKRRSQGQAPQSCDSTPATTSGAFS